MNNDTPVNARNHDQFAAKPVETFFLQADPLTGEPFEAPEPQYVKVVPVYDRDTGELVEFLKPRPLAKTIIAEVAVAHDVTPADITGPRRFPHLVEARREAMSRVRKELGYSYPQIGRIFNRDHSSVIWSLRGGRFNQPKQERAA